MASRRFMIGFALVVIGLLAVVIWIGNRPPKPHSELHAALEAGTGEAHPKSIVRVPHADSALQAAARRAQKELNGFIEELRNPRPGEVFAIKGAFETGFGPEYLWVRNPVFSGDEFTGTLDQAPGAYRGARKGDPVTVKRKDVFDWLIKDGSNIRGMYTDKVLAR